MMIMPANNTAGLVHYLCGKFPDKIGLLISPNSWKVPPWYITYALDNGAFTGFKKDIFLSMLSKVDKLKNKPLWVAVPDKVGDAEETNRRWFEWNKKINYPLAFVVQDGHEPKDVPKNCTCVFIGGTTNWKLLNGHKFKGVAELLHVGRVNTLGRLNWAFNIGADSIDGTGWFRSLEQKQILTDFCFDSGKWKKVRLLNKLRLNRINSIV